MLSSAVVLTDLSNSPVPVAAQSDLASQSQWQLLAESWQGVAQDNKRLRQENEALLQRIRQLEHVTPKTVQSPDRAYSDAVKVCTFNVAFPFSVQAK